MNDESIRLTCKGSFLNRFSEKKQKNQLLGYQALVGSVFVLLATGHLTSNPSPAGGFLAALCVLGGLLLARSSLPPAIKKPTLWLPLALVGYGALSLFLFQPLLQTSPQEGWIFSLALYLAFPPLAFGLLNFRQALWITSAFALGVHLLAMLNLEGDLRLLFLLLFWLTTLLILTDALFQQERQMMLEDYLSKNPRSGFFNQKQFERDLVKEQERAKREGTALGLLRLACKPLLSTQPLVSAYFAPFERLYHLDDEHLVVLLPLAAADQLALRLQNLQDETQKNGQSLGVLAACLCDLKATPQDLSAQWTRC